MVINGRIKYGVTWGGWSSDEVNGSYRTAYGKTFRDFLELSHSRWETGR